MDKQGCSDTECGPEEPRWQTQRIGSSPGSCNLTLVSNSCCGHNVHGPANFGGLGLGGGQIRPLAKAYCCVITGERHCGKLCSARRHSFRLRSPSRSGLDVDAA